MSEQDTQPNPPDGKSRPTYEGNRFEDAQLQRVHSQLLREKDEPTENLSPMPLFLVALFMILAFWAGFYLVKYSGDFGPFHYDETQPVGGLASAGPKEVDMMALGTRIFAQNCAVCHQQDGRGQAGVYPPLVASDWVRDNPERLVKVVLAGLAGPVVVNGNPYNNAMTAFGRLSDQQIAAVLTYIRTSADYENNSYAVSPELVAQVRAEYGARAEPWSAPELEAIHGPVVGSWSPPAAASEVVDEPEAAVEAPSVGEG